MVICSYKQAFKMKRGFTLAEILITLVVIGVIAAITIPVLINQTKNNELINAFKKTYSSISNGIRLSQAKDGNDIFVIEGDNLDATRNFMKYLKPHLSTIKDCGFSTGEDACFPNVEYKYLDGATFGYLSTVGNSYKLRLSDGSSVAFIAYPSGNINIYIDVNGDKAPNVFGKDTFVLVANMTDNVAPIRREEEEKCLTDSRYCAAWILSKGNMDYLKKYKK